MTRASDEPTSDEAAIRPATSPPFEIGHSDLIRHSNFDIRH
jgi:hypothetical protein